MLTIARDEVPAVEHLIEYDEVDCAVVFTDFVSSTSMIRSVGDLAWMRTLAVHDAIVDSCLRETGGRLVESTGDGAMAVYDEPALALEGALLIAARLGDAGLPVRIGAHAGPALRRGESYVGLTVHLAARVMSLASAGEVAFSETLVVAAGSTAAPLGPPLPMKIRGLDAELGICFAYCGDAHA